MKKFNCAIILPTESPIAYCTSLELTEKLIDMVKNKNFDTFYFWSLKGMNIVAFNTLYLLKKQYDIKLIFTVGNMVDECGYQTQYCQRTRDVFDEVIIHKRCLGIKESIFENNLVEKGLIELADYVLMETIELRLRDYAENINKPIIFVRSCGTENLSYYRF